MVPAALFSIWMFVLLLAFVFVLAAALTRPGEASPGRPLAVALGTAAALSGAGALLSVLIVRGTSEGYGLVVFALLAGGLFAASFIAFRSARDGARALAIRDAGAGI